MNILMLVKNSGVGGILSCVRSLNDGLLKYGDNVVIGTCQGEGVQRMLQDCKVEIIDFNAKTLRERLTCYKTLAKTVKEHKIEMIHAQNRIPAVYASIYCFFHPKVKYIWSNHLVPIPYSFVHRLMTKYGKFAVAEAIDGRNFLVEKLRIPEKKVKIVNLGSDLEKFKRTSDEEQNELKSKLGIQEHHKVVLLYGRLTPTKGHLFLIEAFSKLAEEKKDSLRIIFPGENETFKQQIDDAAQKHGLLDKIIYPGFINSAEYLSISDLMVLPSEIEGFGIVNVEAFAMDVPVIRTKTAGYLDMEDCCLGVEYGDVEVLTDYINYLWDAPEKLETMAKLAKEKVSRFSNEKMTEKYREIYKECLGLK